MLEKLREAMRQQGPNVMTIFRKSPRVVARDHDQVFLREGMGSSSLIARNVFDRS